MESQFRADPNLKYESIAARICWKSMVLRCLNHKCIELEERLKEQHEGNHAESYSKIRKYAELVRQSNPGSMAKLVVDSSIPTNNPRFSRFFLCLDAMRKRFIAGCKPLIGLDGCHLKVSYFNLSNSLTLNR